MAVLGPAVLFASWPWMWFHTVDRFREYLNFHLQHVHYNFEYLGTNYNNPPYPRSYAYVMTLLTAPVTTLALSVAGVVALLFREPPPPPVVIKRQPPQRPAKPVPADHFEAATVGVVDHSLGRPDYGFGAPAREQDKRVLALSPRASWNCWSKSTETTPWCSFSLRRKAAAPRSTRQIVSQQA
jgi:hypothetical protein